MVISIKHPFLVKTAVGKCWATFDFNIWSQLDVSQIAFNKHCMSYILVSPLIDCK